MANEKRLIDANALMVAFRRYMMERFDKKKCVSEENCKTCKFSCLWRKIVSVAPTVDAVEVVRCKDCKHCKDHPTSGKVKMCTNEQQWVTECYPLVHDGDFCSYGERKDNG